jgi:hypothetical protein
MKLNKETLKQIIKEELEAVLGESRILSKYTKDKEEELRQYIQDMGKDPDEVRDALGTGSFNMMGQSLINNYPRTMPLSRDSKIRFAQKEMETYFGSMEDFYNPDSSGSSSFSKVLKLLPELRELRRVKKVLQKVGGDPARVTAKIGGRPTFVVIRRKVKDLYDNLEDVLEKYQDTRDYSESPYEIGYKTGFLGLPPYGDVLSDGDGWGDDDDEYNRGYLDGLEQGGHNTFK